MVRITAAAVLVILILGLWAALVLSLTTPGGTPDGSPAHPYPTVIPGPPVETPR